MPNNVMVSAASAYAYPLLIRHLLDSPLVNAPDNEIAYRNLKRYNYREFRLRVGRLANMLSTLGVKQGDTVGVLDWDSHRYLECYFAVPMMGAVLHTVNIRLSAEQLLYTINHAEDDILLVNADFIPLLDAIKDRLVSVKTLVFISDNPGNDRIPDGFAGEYETMLTASSSGYNFIDFDENRRATTFYTTGTTGHPKGGLLQSPSACAPRLGRHGCTWYTPTPMGVSTRKMFTCLSPPCFTSMLGGSPILRRRWG